MAPPLLMSLVDSSYFTPTSQQHTERHGEKKDENKKKKDKKKSKKITRPSYTSFSKSMSLHCRLPFGFSF